MSGANFSIVVNEAAPAMRALEKGMPAAVRAIINNSTNAHRALMTQRLRTGYATIGPHRGLRRRTGSLLRSLAVEPAKGETIRDLTGAVVIGKGLGHGRIHEHGGEIKAKKKFLTIPMRHLLTGAGVLKAAAGLTKKGDEWHTKGRVPRAEGTKTWIMRRKGTLRIYTLGSNGKPLALYTLKPSVKMPPRLGFGEVWRRSERARYREGERILGILVARAAKSGRGSKPR